MSDRRPSSLPADSMADHDLASAQALAGAGAWAEALAVLARITASGAGGVVARLLHGEALLRTGREREALALLRDTVAAAAATDGAAHRRAHNLIGAACFALGALDDAAAAWSEALDLASRDDDQLLLARASNNLGAIANMQGRHDEALGHYRLAIPAYQRAGQARGIAEGYHNLAITCRDLGALEEADEHERRAIDYATSSDAARVAAMGRVGRAEIALRRGDAAFAESAAGLALQEFEKHGDALNATDARRLVGAALAAQGRTDAALSAFEGAFDIAAERGYLLVQAEVLRDRVEAWRAVGDAAHARDDAERALALFAQLGAASEMERLARVVAELG